MLGWLSSRLAKASVSSRRRTKPRFQSWWPRNLDDRVH